jgi:hypothetical protein
MRIFILALLLFANANAKAADKDITVSLPAVMSLDQYMERVVSNIRGTPAFDTQVNPRIEVEGTLVLHIGIISKTDSQKLKKLYEQGIWTSPNGPTYDFRKTAMFFPTGLNDINDFIANFAGGSSSLKFSVAKLSNAGCVSLLSDLSQKVD